MQTRLSARIAHGFRNRDWTALLLEFAIVVLGVYFAVWVADAQSARERSERTLKVVATLRQELKDSQTVDERLDASLAQAFTRFESARQRGEMVPPVYLRISGSDTPPRSPCQGVFQNQLVDLIEPGLLWELCFYYDERDGLGRKFLRYAAFVEDEILPRLQQDPAVFYVDDGATLAPSFAAGMARLQDWRRDIATLHSWSRCLEQRLADPTTPGASCRPPVGGYIDTGTGGAGSVQ